MDMLLNPLQYFINKLFEGKDRLKAISTWRFSRQIGENFYYKNTITRKGLLVDKDGNPKDHEGNDLSLQEAFNRQYKRYSIIMEHRPSTRWFKLYEGLKFAGRSVLDEGHRNVGKFIIPDIYDHLKWDLSDDQILELHRFVHYPLEAMTESDMRNLSKTLGIPKSNLISIHNTYSPQNQNVKFVTDWGEWEKEKYPNTHKGLVVTAKDAGMTTSMNKQPQLKGGGKPISNYQTPAEKRLETSNFRMQKTNKNPEEIQEYPRLDEFLMMCLSVEYKPISVDLSPTNKIIMAVNAEESGHELYERIGEGLDEFNDVYGTGYIMTGSYFKEGEDRIMIGVDYKPLSNLSKPEFTRVGIKEVPALVGAKEREALKHQALDSLFSNYHDRIHGQGHWDKDKNKIMRKFLSGELGYLDDKKTHEFG